MSVEGKKGTKERKVPKWESELWDYLSSGEGEWCPIYSRCQTRLSGGWCPSDNLGYIAQLLDDKQFNIRKYDFMGESGECGGVFQLVERLAHRLQHNCRIGRTRNGACPLASEYQTTRRARRTQVSNSAEPPGSKRGSLTEKRLSISKLIQIQPAEKRPRAGGNRHTGG